MKRKKEMKIFVRLKLASTVDYFNGFFFFFMHKNHGLLRIWGKNVDGFISFLT